MKGTFNNSKIYFLKDKPFDPNNNTKEEIHNSPKNTVMDRIADNRSTNTKQSCNNFFHTLNIYCLFCLSRKICIVVGNIIIDCTGPESRSIPDNFRQLVC